MTSESRRCHIRQLCLGGDQIQPHMRDVRGITPEQMTDLRDAAWTARDLVSLSEPGPREAFWWEERWPRTTYQGWGGDGRLPLDFREVTA